MATKTVGGTSFPSSDFLVVEDASSPSTWHLQVKEHGKPNHNLMGAAYAALLSPGGHRGNKYQGPGKQGAISKLRALYKSEGMDWPGDTKTASVDTLSFAQEPGMVYRAGLIFKAGDYPDKDLVVTAEDLQAAVDAFSAPVDAELEHINTQGINTFLDGKLGKLVAIWREGESLFGQVAVPAWLDPLWAEAGRKVSIVWHGASRSIARIGLVLSPRVADAAVMSAYTAFCDSNRAVSLAGRRHSGADAGDIQQIHDLAARQGADCTPSQETPMGVTGGRRMNLAFWKQSGRGFRDEARAEGVAVPDESMFSVLDDAEHEARERARTEVEASFAARLAQAEAETAAAREEVRRVTATRLQGEGAAFADGLITAGRLYPAERELLIANYTQAGMDDAASGMVTFGEQTTSRVEQLKALYAARPAHGLTKEQLGTFSVIAGGRTEGPAGPDALSNDQLLAKTALGRRVLAERKNGH